MTRRLTPGGSPRPAGASRLHESSARMMPVTRPRHLWSPSRREMLAVVEDAASRPLELARAAAAAALHAGTAVPEETHVVEAWGRCYDEAPLSIASWGADDATLTAEIAAARQRVSGHAMDCVASLSPCSSSSPSPSLPPPRRPRRRPEATRRSARR